MSGTLVIQAYSRAIAITKSDTANFDGTTGPNPTPPAVNTLCDSIYVGGAGIVVAVMGDDTAIQFTCVAGQVLPIRAKRVNSGSTTATLMIALYQY